MRPPIQCFEQALIRDPGFAKAHAGIAISYVRLSINGFLSAEEALPRAEEAAFKAVELDDSLAEAHLAVGNIRSWLRWDRRGAEAPYKRAIELSPGYAEAHRGYATGCLSPLGRTQESLAEIRRACELDPLSMAINRIVGEILYWDRQYDEAIRQFRHTVEMAPDFPLVRTFLANAYTSNDMPEESLHERQEVFRRSGRQKEVEEVEAAYAEGGEPGVLRWYIQRGLPRVKKTEAARGSGNRAFNMATLYARLGDTDEAFGWLEEAVRRRDGWVTCTKVHPWLDGLRSDSRYLEVLKTMNLAD